MSLSQKFASGRVLQSFDAFGKALPVFNLKGEDRVTTRIGGAVTLLIALTALLYAAVKFGHLTEKYNPQMSSYYDDIQIDTVLDLSEQGFRFAFTVEDYSSPK